MLHIHSGDAAADALRRAGLEGTHIVWTDLLMTGPLRPDAGYAVFIRDRAETLSAATGGGRTPEQCEGFLRDQDERLTLWENHAETVLWVDACLYDQAILARLLAWFSRIPAALSRLSLLCVDDHPSVSPFHGLGQLRPPVLADLLPRRKRVTRDEVAQAAATWAAMCSTDPADVLALSSEVQPALPSMTLAMQRWLEQFPSTVNGLNRLQEEALQALDERKTVSPVSVFRHASSVDAPAFFGDTYLWKCLNDMAFCKTSLLSIDQDKPLELWEPEGIAERCIRRTPAGTDVLAGRRDAIELNGIDRWIGGVHLEGTDDSPWRWNRSAHQLAECTR